MQERTRQSTSPTGRLCREFGQLEKGSCIDVEVGRRATGTRKGPSRPTSRGYSRASFWSRKLGALAAITRPGQVFSLRLTRPANPEGRASSYTNVLRSSTRVTKSRSAILETGKLLKNGLSS